VYTPCYYYCTVFEAPDLAIAFGLLAGGVGARIIDDQGPTDSMRRCPSSRVGHSVDPLNAMAHPAVGVHQLHIKSAEFLGQAGFWGSPLASQHQNVDWQ
jgi:hypothetical protein